MTRRAETGFESEHSRLMADVRMNILFVQAPQKSADFNKSACQLSTSAVGVGRRRRKAEFIFVPMLCSFSS